MSDIVLIHGTSQSRAGIDGSAERLDAAHQVRLAAAVVDPRGWGSFAEEVAADPPAVCSESSAP